MNSPSRIRLLPDEVTNQIAAGEVVERPASVLKELVENSLDAGARRVVVETSGGGRRLVKVVDDGQGMGPDDLLMALERHATSKLTGPEDLASVATLGFRGEALPSIASVSRLTLRSRQRGAASGSEVRVEGGLIRGVEEVGAPEGTTVEMRDLFFNTPARRKFLRSAATENGHLGAALARLALGRPEIAFRYRNGTQMVYDLPAASDPKARAAALLGREAAAAMVRLEEEADGLVLTGLAGLPSFSRPAADWVHTYVGGRHVRDKVLLHAVNQAYRGLIPPDRRAVVVLHIGLPPGEVDVNVHPAKVEVRFRDQGRIHDALVEALRRGLAAARRETIRSFAPPQDGWEAIPRPEEGREGKKDPTGPGGGAHPRPRVADGGYPETPGYGPPPAPEKNGAWKPPIDPAGAQTPQREGAPIPAEPFPAHSPRPRALFTPAGEISVIGQLHGLYVLCSTPEGLVIMDQHAAHERLTYEAMSARLREGALPRQGLLVPAILELTPQEAAWAAEQAPAWEGLGLVLEPFGGLTWTVSAVPPHLAGRDPGAAVRDLLSEMAHSGLKVDTPEFLNRAVTGLACRASIKQGQRLSPAELQDLASRAALLPSPVTCPHGRPVFLLLSRSDLARWFKRSGN